MLTNYRRRSGAIVRNGVRRGTAASVAVRTTRAIVEAAKKLAPYARAAGAKSTIQRKLGPVGGVQKRIGRKTSAIASGVSYDTPGNDYSRVQHKLGRKKKNNVATLRRLLEAGMEKRIYRWQSITNYDTNVGAMCIPNALITTNPANNIVSPFHVYELSSLLNGTGNVTPGRYFGWDGTTGAANLVRGVLFGNQDANGNQATTGAWQIEHQGGDTSSGVWPNASRVRHDWTDIRLNLYGPRKRTTRYDIMFVRCKDDQANLHAAATTNVALRELVQYIERPCIYSNIQSQNAASIYKKLQVVKTYTYYIPGGQTTDVDTAVGKIKEVRIFMRHDKIYNLDWKEDSTAIGHAQADGLDFTSDSLHFNHPWHGSRLFMIVRAFAPERVSLSTYTGDTISGSPVSANTDPTYDIIIRNCFTFPS